MSSVLLYLAIVAMWLGVLVPMWLRRDRYVLMDEDKDNTEGDTLIESLDQAVAPPTTSRRRLRCPNPPRPPTPSSRPTEGGPASECADAEPCCGAWPWSWSPGWPPSLGMVAWWGVAPAALLLGLYVLLLRVASKLEDEQQDLAARVRADRVRRARAEARRAAEAAREAEIIELEKKRAYVFDQYADHRRAVGD